MAITEKNSKTSDPETTNKVTTPGKNEVICDDLLNEESVLGISRLDYGDLKEVWKGLIDSKRTDAESRLLYITTRTTELDPIAKQALAATLAKVKESIWDNAEEGAKATARSATGEVTAKSSDNRKERLHHYREQPRYAIAQETDILDALRKKISQKGWATELLSVNKRINSLRLSENKRVVLAAVYPYLLYKILTNDASDESVSDAVGFTNEVLFEFERQGGALDIFAQEIVVLVGAKNRINLTQDNVLRDLVAHQVRAGF